VVEDEGYFAEMGCNIAALLPQMVAEALALVSPEDCFGWVYY